MAVEKLIFSFRQHHSTCKDVKAQSQRPITKENQGLISTSLICKVIKFLIDQRYPDTSHGWTNTYRRSCHANLIHIRACNPRLHDLPKIFLSNTISMVNKLDKICAVVTSNGSDIAVITESWPSSNISNDLINTLGFVPVRRDRPDDQRGRGLCTYINSLTLQN